MNRQETFSEPTACFIPVVQGHHACRDTSVSVDKGVIIPELPAVLVCGETGFGVPATRLQKKD